MPSEVITLQLGQCGNQSMKDCHHLTKKLLLFLLLVYYCLISKS